VLDELVPCAAVSRGVGQKILLFLLGAQGRREGTGVVHVQGEEQEFRGEGLQQHV